MEDARALQPAHANLALISVAGVRVRLLALCLLTRPWHAALQAVPAEKAELKDMYQCPVYFTEARFRQEVFTAQLKTKQCWIKWTTAGVCMFLDVC